MPIIISQNVLDFTTTSGQVAQAATIDMRPQVAPWTIPSEVQTVAAGGKTAITVTF
jgi:D-alanyl-D-alanine carboxypeptidase/D-alanyl-D-alanine-endopeptidase (penicillin-binding protein 4)